MGYTFGVWPAHQVESFTLKTKISSKKFPITPPEKGLVVLGMEALFKNQFAMSETFTVLKKSEPKNSAEKNCFLVSIIQYHDLKK